MRTVLGTDHHAIKDVYLIQLNNQIRFVEFDYLSSLLDKLLKKSRHPPRS